MKKVSFVLLVLFSLFASSTVAYAESREEIARKLYGCIYVTENESEADYSVFVEKECSLAADINVRVCSFDEIVNSPGEWRFVEESVEADFCIYFVKHWSHSDISVYFEN